MHRSRIVPENSSGKQHRKRHRRKKQSEQNLSIFFNNVNGFACKKDSLSEIIKVCQPDIIGLCETKLGKKEAISLEGYETIISNYKIGQEGLAVAVKKGTYRSTPEVMSEKTKNIM